MKYGYSTQLKGPRAMGRSLRISPRQAKEVADAVRGMQVGKAEKFLERVIAMEEPVKYKRYIHKISHMRGGTGTGGYPLKTAEAFLKVIKSAEANAKVSPETLVIKHVSANAGRVLPGSRKGSPQNCPTVHLQVVLGEK